MKSTLSPSVFMALASSWFKSKIPSRNASLIRILIYGYIFYYFLKYPNTEYAKLDAEFWEPTGLARFMDFMKPPFLQFPALDFAWKISLFTSAIGFFSRTSKILAFIGFAIVGAYDQHFGYVTFSGIPLFVVFFYLIFLRDEEISLDRFIFKKNHVSHETVDVWPVLCFQIFLIFLYMCSGIQKLRISDSYWLDGATLYPFLRDIIIDEFLVFSAIAGSILVLILELTSPLIFYWRAKKLYVFGFLVFHLLSYMLLHVQANFWILLLLTFFFTGKKENHLSTSGVSGCLDG